MAKPTYTPTTWVNDTAPAISADNLNHIEQGVSAVTTYAAASVQSIVAGTGVTVDNTDPANPKVEVTAGTFDAAGAAAAAQTAAEAASVPTTRTVNGHALSANVTLVASDVGAMTAADVGVDVKSYGATGNGTTDDSAALVAAIAALTSGGVLYFPPGTYLCTGLSITSLNDIAVVGNGAWIVSSVETSPVLHIQSCNRVLVRGLRVKHATQSARNGGGFGIHAKLCTDVLITDNAVTQTCSAGIYNDGNVRVGIVNNYVYDNLSDGIHTTNAATDVTVSGNRVVQSGDDGIAVVSYQSDPGPCQRFAITGNTVYQTPTRGISVVGGVGGTISGNTVDTTSGANVYIAQEAGTTPTLGVTDVNVVGNMLRNACTYGTIIANHGAVMINNVTAAYPVDGITVVGNAIRTPGYAFIKADGVSTTVTRINIAENHCLGPQSQTSAPAGILLGGNATEVHCHGNYVGKAYAHGIQTYSPIAWIHDNIINLPNQGNTTGKWGIQKAGGTPTIYSNVVIPDATNTNPLSGWSSVGSAAGGAVLAATDVGAVPTSTTVNGHALSGNVTVSASDLTTGTLPLAQASPYLMPVIPEASGVYPNRPAWTGPCQYVGPDTPPSGGTTAGGAGAVSGLDIWFKTAS